MCTWQLLYRLGCKRDMVDTVWANSCHTGLLPPFRDSFLTEKAAWFLSVWRLPNEDADYCMLVNE